MILSQCYEEVLGCKGASGGATPRPHRHSNFVKPPQYALCRGNGCGNGDVCPMREPPPTREAKGAAREGRRLGGDCVDPPSPAPRRPRRLRSGAVAKRQCFFLHLMNSLNCLLVSIIQAEFSLIQAAFCAAGCILLNHRCLDMG